MLYLKQTKQSNCREKNMLIANKKTAFGLSIVTVGHIHPSLKDYDNSYLINEKFSAVFISIK